MSARHLMLVGMTTFACALGGCERDRSQPSGLAANTPDDPAGPVPRAPDPVELELTRFPRELTRSTTALTNLNGQIGSLETALERQPSSVLNGTQLVHAWLSRSQFLGTYGDFKRADDLTQALVAASPSDPAVHALRAALLSSVHRFDEADAAVARAVELGDASAQQARATHDLARGRDLEQVLELREQALERSRSFTALSDVAAAEAALGRFEEADAHYRQALETYRDVSPLPIAWVFFQRGVMWGEMADEPAAARTLYEEAVRILPKYVAANVHLAEREHADADVDDALARLERLAEQTEDPEPKSRLSQYLEERDPLRAAELGRDAERGYAALMRDHPHAFLDHAAEFYANAGGDPDHALELALTNLSQRKNARAYIVALQAAEAAEDASAWCTLASDASSRARHNRNLQAMLEARPFECEG